MDVCLGLFRSFACGGAGLGALSDAPQLQARGRQLRVRGTPGDQSRFTKGKGLAGNPSEGTCWCSLDSPVTHLDLMLVLWGHQWFSRIWSLTRGPAPPWERPELWVCCWRAPGESASRMTGEGRFNLQPWIAVQVRSLGTTSGTPKLDFS